MSALVWLLCIIWSWWENCYSWSTCSKSLGGLWIITDGGMC